MRNAQVSRILQIIRDLDQLGGVNIYDLSLKYGVSTRTIKRDINALEDAGLPMLAEINEVTGKKQWRIAFRDHLTKLKELLDFSHYNALIFALHRTESFKNLSIFDALEDLADKLEKVLGKKRANLLQMINQALYSFEKQNYLNTPPDILWPLVEAISKKLVCIINYNSLTKGEICEYKILPLKIVNYKNALYLFVYILKYKEVRRLNLHRMESLSVTSQTMEPPDDFSLQKLETSSFGIYSGGDVVTYKLEFNKEVAGLIREKQWHVSQEILESSNGKILLSFTCQKSPEVDTWIAGWMDSVIVIEPNYLKEKLKQVGDSYQKLYSS